MHANRGEPRPAERREIQRGNMGDWRSQYPVPLGRQGAGSMSGQDWFGYTSMGPGRERYDGVRSGIPHGMTGYF